MTSPSPTPSESGYPPGMELTVTPGTDLAVIPGTDLVVTAKPDDASERAGYIYHGPLPTGNVAGRIADFVPYDFTSPDRVGVRPLGNDGATYPELDFNSNSKNIRPVYRPVAPRIGAAPELAQRLSDLELTAVANLEVEEKTPAFLGLRSFVINRRLNHTKRLLKNTSKSAPIHKEGMRALLGIPTPKEYLPAGTASVEMTADRLTRLPAENLRPITRKERKAHKKVFIPIISGITDSATEMLRLERLLGTDITDSVSRRQAKNLAKSWRPWRSNSRRHILKKLNESDSEHAKRLTGRTVDGKPADPNLAHPRGGSPYTKSKLRAELDGVRRHHIERKRYYDSRDAAELIMETGITNVDKHLKTFRRAKRLNARAAVLNGHKQRRAELQTIAHESGTDQTPASLAVRGARTAVRYYGRHARQGVARTVRRVTDPVVDRRVKSLSTKAAEARTKSRQHFNDLDTYKEESAGEYSRIRHMLGTDAKRNVERKIERNVSRKARRALKQNERADMAESEAQGKAAVVAERRAKRPPKPVKRTKPVKPTPITTVEPAPQPVVITPDAGEAPEVIIPSEDRSPRPY